MAKAKPKAKPLKFDVLNRLSGKVQFTAEINCAADARPNVKLGLAVKWAVKAHANLAHADLAHAYLEDADLADAYLAGANLEGAYLARANLAGADLARANLARANLAHANLARANLEGADLARADLAHANLAHAYLAGANLEDAYLSRANLADANLADAYLARANLAGADLIDGGQRSDGYRFVGSIKNGVLMISAGCRHFSIAAAREHWKHRDGTPLGAETTCILNHIEEVAVIRSLIPAAKQESRNPTK